LMHKNVTRKWKEFIETNNTNLLIIKEQNKNKLDKRTKGEYLFNNV